jgi:hypothetical protein
MESKPPVEAGPPVLIESVVRLLLPAPTREHVLGDLAERYSTPGRYVGEALRTVPFVIVSQIRRTSQFALAPLVVLVLFQGFSTGAGRNAPWYLTLIPVTATMVGFMLRDAYKTRDLQHPWRQGLVDVSVAAAFVAGSQALVAAARPEWLLTPPGVVGGTVVLGLLYLLRIQNPGRSPACVPPDVETMTLAQLHGEIDGYATVMRRAAKIECGAALVLIPLFTTFALMAPQAIIKLGAAVTVAGAGYVLWRMWRSLGVHTPIAAETDFASTAAIYRGRLQQQQHALRTIWLWYLLPLTIGPAIVLAGASLRAARPDFVIVGTAIAFVVGWGAIVWPARRHASRMQTRISALQRAEESR